MTTMANLTGAAATTIDIPPETTNIEASTIQMLTSQAGATAIDTKPGTATATTRADGTTHKQGLLITTTSVPTSRATGTDTGTPIPSSEYAMSSGIATKAVAALATAAAVQARSGVHDQKICHA